MYQKPEQKPQERFQQGEKNGTLHAERRLCKYPIEGDQKRPTQAKIEYRPEKLNAVIRNVGSAGHIYDAVTGEQDKDQLGRKLIEGTRSEKSPEETHQCEAYERVRKGAVKVLERKTQSPHQNEIEIRKNGDQGGESPDLSIARSGERQRNRPVCNGESHSYPRLRPSEALRRPPLSDSELPLQALGRQPRIPVRD